MVAKNLNNMFLDLEFIFSNKKKKSKFWYFLVTMGKNNKKIETLPKLFQNGKTQKKILIFEIGRFRASERALNQLRGPIIKRDISTYIRLFDYQICPPVVKLKI